MINFQVREEPPCSHPIRFDLEARALYVPLSDDRLMTTKIVSPTINVDLSSFDDVVGIEILLPDHVDTTMVAIPSTQLSRYERLSISSIQESLAPDAALVNVRTGILMIRIANGFSGSGVVHLLRPEVAIVVTSDRWCELYIRHPPLRSLERTE